LNVSRPPGAIVAEKLGKRYRIGALRAERTFREALSSAGTAPFRAMSRSFRGTSPARESAENIWALRDASFVIDPGEKVGLIGRNGAGKSTLLKILSRITTPTTGRAAIYGRVGSLLEVGTGFHMELTGRENVMLNGAILGMSRREVAAKFDEIVDFADIERFIDVPLKRYSSGMQMRLAFSVAASLEPEILLVDEVLAVGDANFQRKCLGRMEEVSSSGRTIVFVSHNVSAVLRLCGRVIMLDQGSVVADGPATTVVRSYLDEGAGRSAERLLGERTNGDDVATLRAVRVVDSFGEISESIDIRNDIFISVEYDRYDTSLDTSVNLHFFNDEGICLFISSDSISADVPSLRIAAKGRVRSVCRIPGNFLAEGTVYVHAAVSSYNPTRVHAYEADAVAFQVVDSMASGTARGAYANDLPGVVRPFLDWRIHTSDDSHVPAD
jgi:lipopolysaccharide transport system ATP-binding protein